MRHNAQRVAQNSLLTRAGDSGAHKWTPRERTHLQESFVHLE